jgi:spore coat protein JC
MWLYQKKLQYPVNIKKRNIPLAKALLSQYGGPDSELSACLRYLNQRYTMPDDKGKCLLTDIATEEIAHLEIIGSMIYQLMKDATLEELKEVGLDSHYAEHGKGLFPTDANGIPFTVMYFATTGDPVADLSEDRATTSTDDLLRV